MRVRPSVVQVRGQKIMLREKRQSDAENDYQWGIDEELSRLDAASPLRLTFQQAVALYEEELAYPVSRRQRLAIDTLDGVHIGNCMFYDINHSRSEAELGIMIGDRRYWGRSYGTDAVKTLLQHIFAETSLNRVYLHTLAWNTRAKKAFLKAGFVDIGHLRRNGHNFIAMEVLRSEWHGDDATQT